jgi:hypothetical protein
VCSSIAPLYGLRHSPALAHFRHRHSGQTPSHPRRTIQFTDRNTHHPSLHKYSSSSVSLSVHFNRSFQQPISSVVSDDPFFGRLCCLFITLVQITYALCVCVFFHCLSSDRLSRFPLALSPKTKRTRSYTSCESTHVTSGVNTRQTPSNLTGIRTTETTAWQLDA